MNAAVVEGTAVAAASSGRQANGVAVTVLAKVGSASGQAWVIIGMEWQMTFRSGMGGEGENKGNAQQGRPVVLTFGLDWAFGPLLPQLGGTGIALSEGKGNRDGKADCRGSLHPKQCTAMRRRQGTGGGGGSMAQDQASRGQRGIIPTDGPLQVGLT